MFVGRRSELASLQRRLDRVQAGAGTAVAIRGRRQVGKSRLVQEFCDAAHVAGVRYVYFTATKGASPTAAVAAFTSELRHSGLAADPELIPQHGGGGWPDAFRALAAALPDSPSIVVIDELPWLSEQDDLFDGALQTAWNRLLSTRPLLLLLLGSDLHMMQRLTAYDRPFYGRADNMILGPLNVAEVATATNLQPDEAIDAQLIMGGLPGILRSWSPGTPPLEFLRQACEDPAAPVFSMPESSLLAEFPSPDRARRVIEAIGAGSRTHANIAATAGGRQGSLASGTLTPLLHTLTEDKLVLARDEPVSTRAGKPALYRIADSNLHLYIAMLRTAQSLSRRGRPETAFAQVERNWSTWRGRAVEPLIREALELAAAAGHLPWSDSTAVGGWWNRQFNPEVDLVGADRMPIASRVDFVGSIKWLNTAFDVRDLAALHASAVHVPGYDPRQTGLVAVSRTAPENTLDALDLVWGPREIVSAFQ